MSNLGRGWRSTKRTDAKRSGGGSRRRAWGYRWKFDETPTRVHFGTPETLYPHPVTGEEFPFYTGARHWIPGAGKKHNGAYVECARIIENKDGPPEKCVVCAYTNPAFYGLNISPIPKYANHAAEVYYGVAGWLEEWFHEIEVPNKNDPSKTHRERHRCMGRGCKHCQAGELKVFGKKFYSEIARTHWNGSILQEQEKISSTCRCGGFIYTQDWICVGCGNMLVDLLNNCFNCGSDQIEINADSCKAICQKCQADWSVFECENPEIAKAVDQPFKCSCGVEDYPQARPFCSEEGCEGNGYGIFDCQLKLNKSGEGKKSELHVIDPPIIQEPDSKLFDPQWQGGSVDSERGEKVAIAMKTVLDLSEIMSPDTPENQAQQLDVPNPFAASEAGQTYKSYHRPGPKLDEEQQQQE